MNRIYAKGMALPIVLWLLAALMILVAGLVSLSRSETQLISLQLQLAKADATAEGEAILVAETFFNGLAAEASSNSYFYRAQYKKNELDYDVRVLNASGFVDINSADLSLLADLFTYLGKVLPEQSLEIAREIVKLRQGSINDDSDINAYEEGGKFPPRFGRFLTKEDLLSVLGVNRDLYEAIEDAIYAGRASHSTLNINAAPESVLTVIAKGDEALAKEWHSNQAEGLNLSGIESVEYPISTSGGNSVYRVEVVVKFPDNRRFVKCVWIDNGRPGFDGLPWQVLNSENVKPLGIDSGKDKG